MNGEDVGGIQTECKLSALAQSCQFSGTLDWHFSLVVQTEFCIKEYRCSKTPTTKIRSCCFTEQLSGIVCALRPRSRTKPLKSYKTPSYFLSFSKKHGLKLIYQYNDSNNALFLSTAVRLFESFELFIAKH